MKTNLISLLVAVFLLNSILLTGCSRKRAIRSNLGGSANVAGTANAIQGQITSITEANGLVGWVCEQNMVGATDLVIYAASDLVQNSNLQRSVETDLNAQMECTRISALPFRFTIPYSNLSVHAGKYISVYASPSGSPNLAVLLSQSGVYRIPTPSVAQNNSAQNSSQTAPVIPQPLVPIVPVLPQTPPPAQAGTVSGSANVTSGETVALPVLPQTPPPAPIRYSISGVSSPAQAGTVSGSANVTSGETVALVAQANPGYFFQNWSNCPSVSGANCLVTALGNTTVTAHFAPIPVLSININTPNSLTVSVGNTSCSSSCNVQLNPGIQITLNPVLAYNKKIASWSGCDSMNGNACTLTLNASRTLTLNTANEYPGPEDALELEPGQPAGARPVGYLDGLRGETAFGGWVCQNNVHNSLYVNVYVGTVASPKQRFVGKYEAYYGEDIGVSKACSSRPDSNVYRGRRRFSIPLSAFIADDKNKVVSVYGLKYGTQTEYRIPFGGIPGFTTRVP